MAYLSRKRWELKDLRHACLTFFDPKMTEQQKMEVARNLGRSYASMNTICYSIRARAEDRCTQKQINAAYTIDAARYCMGLQDTPFPPHPAAPEPTPEPEQAVAGDITEPETLQRVMALVKFELGTQSSELLLEQAATLDEIHKILKSIAGSLETQTQLLSELATPATARPNGAADLPTPLSSGFRRHRS